jgi:uncharacterized protein (TIGR02231 family)
VQTGANVIAIEGLSLLMDDSSLQVRVTSGHATVVTAHVERRSRFEKSHTSDEYVNAASAHRESLKTERRLNERLLVLLAERAQNEQLLRQWTAAMCEVPLGVAEPTKRDEWLEAYNSIVNETLQIQRQIDETRPLVAKAKEQSKRLALLAELAAQQVRVLQTLALVQLSATQTGPVELALTYRVACALWRPEHRATLHSLDSKSTVEWVTSAVLWQCTGEQWSDVEVRFSTARPAQASSPPSLHEDHLSTRRKTDYERARVAIEAREETIAVSGLSRGAKSVSEMPGVDDGGEPLNFAPSERRTIESSVAPMRVELLRTTLQATVDRVLYPERAPAPHWRATMSWSAKCPLLAGPVRVARRGSLVGRARVLFVGQGDSFELGFGTDDGVRVRRLIEENRDTVPVLGTQKIHRKLKLSLSNLSGETKTFSLIERIPVSEISDVSVIAASKDGWSMDEKDGYLKRDVTLGPRAIKELEYDYELRAAAKVDLPF